MPQKTILITGGAGYIGSHTAYLMAKQGYRVIILDIFKHQQPFNPRWTTVIRGNCGDKDLLTKIFTTYQITAVMHFAASIEVGESVKNPIPFYENNVSATLSLLDAMLAHRVMTFIFSSSCAVYGIPDYTPIDEDHPKKPISPYGHSKLMIETILRDMHTAYNFNYVALRYFNAAGALPQEGLGEYHKPETHLIPLLLRAALEKQSFSLFGTNHPTADGTCVRDFLHVTDIAHAHIQALDYLEQGNPAQSFNLGTGSGTSVRQMIDAVERIIGLPIAVVDKGARAGDPAALVADARKAALLLGWRPHYSDLNTMVKDAYSYFIGS